MIAEDVTETVNSRECRAKATELGADMNWRPEEMAEPPRQDDRGPACDLPTEVALLSQQMHAVREDVGGVRRALESVSETLSKIALVEERQQQASRTIDRLFGAIEKVATDAARSIEKLTGTATGAIEKLDARIQKLERTDELNKRTNAWVDRAVWAALSGLATLAITKFLS